MVRNVSIYTNPVHRTLVQIYRDARIRAQRRLWSPVGRRERDLTLSATGASVIIQVLAVADARSGRGVFSKSGFLRPEALECVF
jgi:hypothetical protein